VVANPAPTDTPVLGISGTEVHMVPVLGDPHVIYARASAPAEAIHHNNSAESCLHEPGDKPIDSEICSSSWARSVCGTIKRSSRAASSSELSLLLPGSESRNNLNSDRSLTLPVSSNRNGTLRQSGIHSPSAL